MQGHYELAFSAQNFAVRTSAVVRTSLTQVVFEIPPWPRAAGLIAVRILNSTQVADFEFEFRGHWERALISHYPVRLAACDGIDEICCRLEVWHGGEWGTVCDDSFDSTDAGVVCAELGYSGGMSVQSFGGGEGAIWLDEVGCTGLEASLLECGSSGWGTHNCGHSEDVGVCCTGLDS